MKRAAYVVPLVLLLNVAMALAPAFGAGKKKPVDPNPPGSSADAAKADINATLQLANIKVSKLALAQDAGLADAKPTLGPILDRQESATKDAVSKLHSASGDKTRQADALSALDAAGAEAAKYYKDNPTVKDKVSRRSVIINAEVAQISKSPDGYVAALQKAGVKSPQLDQAKGLVKDAAAKAAASSSKSGGDGTSPVIDAQGQVRALLTPDQGKALDAQFGGK
jgi:hypothetical protein